MSWKVWFDPFGRIEHDYPHVAEELDALESLLPPPYPGAQRLRIASDLQAKEGAVTEWAERARATGLLTSTESEEMRRQLITSVFGPRL